MYTAQQMDDDGEEMRKDLEIEQHEAESPEELPTAEMLMDEAAVTSGGDFATYRERRVAEYGTRKTAVFTDLEKEIDRLNQELREDIADTEARARRKLKQLEVEFNDILPLTPQDLIRELTREPE